MKIPRPKITIARLMVAVVCFAFLLPGGYLAVLLPILPALLIYLFPVVFLVSVDGPQKRQTAFSSVIIMGLILFWIPIFLLTTRAMILSDGVGIWQIPILIHVLIFVPAQMIGPIHLARRVFDHVPLNSGEILWAWAGFLIIGMFVIPIQNRQGDAFIVLASFARATSALVVWLVFCGRRPAPDEPRWPHYLGWGLIEYDAVVWGYIGAARLFR